MPSTTDVPRTNAPPPAAVPPPRRYHSFRKRIHFLCFLIFVTLPFFNVMRFDIPRQRFYFAGQELWISEFSIIFFTLMFLLFTIAAASMLYGRIYCGYLCPQMIFSEMSLALEDRFKRAINKRFIEWPPRVRATAAAMLFYGVLAIVSVFLAFVFISYFVEPRDLLRRLFALDIVTAGGIAGAATTLLAFLDFAFVRTRFCTMICPYGYLQGMFSDKQTLLVVYRDGEAKDKACIECKKCVRVCHMGIDIRKSPFQIECIHCGECVEACDDVLGRLKKPGLIHYTWGEKGELLGARDKPWWIRLGLRDAKRAIVLFILLFYASGLTVALSMRHPVQVRINADRTTMYSTNAAGDITNRFRLNLANRSSTEAQVLIAVEGLPAAHVVLPGQQVPIKAGESLQLTFEIAIPAAALPAAAVQHFKIVTITTPKGTREEFPTTFLTPPRTRP